MIKVFLVQSETGFREEMENSIEWEREGYELTGVASDGELAYPIILKEKPDILITDIEMPFMDGLELGRLIRQELPDIKIVIMSECDEFEYARQAIRIGVEEYLLRPVSSIELLEVLRKVSISIRQEREKKELLEKYEEDMWENREYRKEEFLIRILTQSLSVPEILEQAKRMEMDLSARLYNTVFLKISSYVEDEGGQRSIVDVFADVERMLEKQSGIYYFRRGIEGWVVLCLADDQEQMDYKIQLVDEVISQITGSSPLQMEYFGAVGKPVQRLGELKESVDEAERVFAHRYLKKWNQMLSDEGISEGVLAETETETELVSLETAGRNREAAETFMRTGLKSEVAHFVKELLGGFGDANMRSPFFRQYVTIDVYLTAVTVLESIGYDAHELVARCGDFKKMVRAFETVERARKYITRVFEATIELRESVSKYTNTTLLKTARSYIDHNFDNEAISLNTVAASVNLSPNYFSTIFSQEMGVTFIEYLTYVRMKKAKELLRGSSMKTSEIAYAVGYKDAHYFSYLFKKTQKCTPREFKITGVTGNKKEKNKNKK